MAGHVERGTVPGAVTLVSRRGDVQVDVVGNRSLDGPPLRRDSLFRISSMTKPITAVAALTLVEDCLLRLDAPVDDVLPELANRRVLKSLDSELDDTVPAVRSITTRDLLTFRLGFGQLMAQPDAYPILKAANDRSLGMGPPQPFDYPAPDEWLRRLGELPLMCQPGEKWLYHTGSDVLGVLLERVCGKPLDEVLTERVFEPLGMKDTSFSTSDVDRLVTSYQMDYSVFDEPSGGQWSRRPPFLSGGGGLLSTVDDLSAFAHMMLNSGRYQGVRVLSRPMVELMTTDQLTPAQKAVSGFFPGYFDDRGWGFGVSVATARTNVFQTPGRFGWDGGLGTSWQADPKEELTAIMLTQRAGFPDLSAVYTDFWTSVYASLPD
ncbi:beta-lactamase family protein [Amycolatopsis acidiphila]|uniref:Beta-lactamase family protein n=2 Tax=Amycolatopsis acidiphila TaxID=715473 RepID=A0A557ZWX3_9PSEU|nr:beta-lactamase family protein [Amycolatopsis acidiphila]